MNQLLLPLAEKIKLDCENHLTLNSNLLGPSYFLVSTRGRSEPWLIWREYKISALREFLISSDVLRIGSGKVKQIFSLVQLLVARISLVSPWCWSCLSGTWVVKLILRLSVELMNRACKEHIDNNSNQPINQIRQGQLHKQSRLFNLNMIQIANK